MRQFRRLGLLWINKRLLRLTVQTALKGAHLRTRIFSETDFLIAHLELLLNMRCEYVLKILFSFNLLYRIPLCLGIAGLKCRAGCR
jgi:hypothetical protein